MRELGGDCIKLGLRLGHCSLSRRIVGGRSGRAQTFASNSRLIHLRVGRADVGRSFALAERIELRLSSGDLDLRAGEAGQIGVQQCVELLLRILNTRLGLWNFGGLFLARCRNLPAPARQPTRRIAARPRPGRTPRSISDARHR